ncbi:MAG: tetrahydrofolate dehydrogenase/cyclohydrolase catalytic domain-containing protein, partial [Limisphaerales bacterium]
MDNLIDGRRIAGDMHAETAQRVTCLKEQGVVPGLVFIRVGEDPASRVYVGMKERTCNRLGIRST